MQPIIRLAAAAAAALIICLHSGAPAHAQTAGNPPPQTKPAAQAPAKPKPQAKPAAQTAPKQTAAPEVPSRKSVCVASAIGHVFDVQAVGLTVFGNSLEHVTTDSWGIDEAATGAVARILGKDYNVRRLAMPKTALAQFEGPSPGGGWGSNPYSDLVRAVAASAPKCDVYVTLTRMATNFNGTNQYIAGLGILDHSPIIERVWVFASFMVRVYDGENFGLMKSVKPGNLLDGMMGGLGCISRKVDKTWIPTPPSSALQNTRLKNATRQLVEEGVTQALKEVFEGA